MFQFLFLAYLKDKTPLNPFISQTDFTPLLILNLYPKVILPVNGESGHKYTDKNFKIYFSKKES